MGRKKSSRAGDKRHDLKIWPEGHRAIEIVAGYTGEDMIDVANRAAVELGQREIPELQRRWLEEQQAEGSKGPGKPGPKSAPQ